MAVIANTKIRSGQKIASGCGLIPKLAHVDAAKITGDEAVADHKNALTQQLRFFEPVRPPRDQAQKTGGYL